MAQPAPLHTLTHQNISALEASPHLWMVNICRNSCGFCQSLAPRWERLAHSLRNEVHVAYWDAEQSVAPPALLGEVTSTPAIRAVTRRPGGPPVAVDYQGTREPEDLARFARANMPDLVVRVEDEAAWAALARRASEERLPRAIVFTNRTRGATTPALLKRLSTDFESRVLLAEVRPAAHDALAALQGVFAVSALPSVHGLPRHATADTEATRFKWDRAPTYARLHEFLARLSYPHA